MNQHVSSVQSKRKDENYIGNKPKKKKLSIQAGASCSNSCNRNNTLKSFHSQVSGSGHQCSPSTDRIKTFRDKLEIPSEGSKLAQHGNIFQLKLLMLLLWRAKTKGYTSFRLATELSECEKFDDVIFQYEFNGQWWTRLLQAKHKEGLYEVRTSITLKDLLSVDSKNEFSLQKYFNSFVKIRKRCRTNSVYSVLPRSEILDVIICTNIGVAPDVESSLVEWNLEDDDLFNMNFVRQLINLETVGYKLKNTIDNEIIHKLKIIFRETSDFYSLIEEISESIATRKPIEKTGLVKEYYYELAKTVFSVALDKGSFQHDFLNGKNFPTDFNVFRKNLLKEVILKTKLLNRKYLSGIEIKYLDGLKLSADFGKAELPDNKNQLKDLATKLSCDVIRRTIDMNKYTCIAVLLENVIDIKNKEFHKKFFRGKNKLKTDLKDRLQHLGYKMTDDELKNVKFTIQEDINYLEWPSDCHSLFQKICDCIENERTFDANDFEPYHLILARDVIDIERKTWKDDFLNLKSKGGKTIPPEVRKLHRIILDRMVCDKDLNSNSLSELEIKFSEGYVKSFLPQEILKISNMTAFAKQLGMIISQSSNKVVSIDNNCVPANYFQDFMHNFRQLAGHVLIQRYGKIRFRSQFLKSNTLEERLEDFRSELKKHISFNFDLLFEYEFSNITDNKFRKCDEIFLETSLPGLYTNEDYDEFFRKLKFLVNYPNRDEMTNVIREEMQEYFRDLNNSDFNALYQETLHDWMAKRMGTFYTASNMRELFSELKFNLILREMEGVTKSYISSISHAYKFLELSDFSEFLGNTELQVLHIYTDSSTLFRMRIVQTFIKASSKNISSNMRRYLWHGGQLFLSFKQLSNFNFAENVKAAFEKKISLLIIECNDEDIASVYTKFTDTIIKDPSKKLILISPTAEQINAASSTTQDDARRNTFLIDRRYTSKYSMKDISINFECFVEKSKIDILKRQISFQGKTMPLNMLCDIDESANHILNHKVIEELVLTEYIIPVDDIIGLGEVDEYYIPRTFQAEVALTEDEIAEQGEKIFLISDVAGMGKSTVLMKMAFLIKTADPHLWVFKIDLNDYTKIFAGEIQQKKIDLESFEDIVRFLLGFDTDQPVLRTLFEQELLMYNLQKRDNIVFLFDGFDEICPHYKNFTIKILKTLSSAKLRKIFITTRPHLREDLEKQLGTTAFSLVPFSDENQKEFLIKFWKTKLSLGSIDSKDQMNRIEIYAKSLIDNLTDIVDKSIQKFTGIALQLRMVAEVFLHNSIRDKKSDSASTSWQGCREFLYSGEETPQLSHKLDLYSLYKGFIRRKYEIYFSIKKREDSTNVPAKYDREIVEKHFFDQHQLLGIFDYFDEEIHTMFFSKAEEKNIDVLLRGKVNVGLVNMSDSSQLSDSLSIKTPLFVHRTFAEYFVAYHISNIILHDSENNDYYRALWIFILMEVLMNHQYDIIRYFINGRLAECSGDNLHLDCRHNFEKLIEFLWEEGALQDKDGETFMHVAASESHDYIIFVLWGLFSEKIKTSIIDKGNKHETTLLHLACSRGNLNLVRWLVKPRIQGGAGANVEAKNLSESTPLHLAIDHIDLVKWLIKPALEGGGGADIYAEDRAGEKVIHRYISRGNLEVVQWLLETKSNGGAEVSLDTEDAHGSKLIHHIANSSIFRPLLSWLISRYNINIYAKDGDGNTILHYVAYKGQLELLKWLVAPVSEGGVGADVTVRSDDGSTLLHEAALSGNIELVKWLLSFEAMADNVSTKDNNGRTVLHDAAKYGNLNVIEAFASMYQFDATEKDEEGKSILYEAVCFGQLQIVKFLFSVGIQATFNHIDHTILHAAARHGESRLIKWLIHEAGIDINCLDMNKRIPLHEACQCANIDVGKWLIEDLKEKGFGGLINAPDKNNRTPLHEIICSSLETNMDGWLKERYLIPKTATESHGVYQIQVSDDLPAPITYFLNQKYGFSEDNGKMFFNIDKFDLIEALLLSGAKIDSEDKWGNNAIHLAASSDLSESLDLIKLLIDQGSKSSDFIDFTKENSYGKSVLHYAIDKIQVNLLEWLLMKTCDGGAGVDCGKVYSNKMDIMEYAFRSDSLEKASVLSHLVHATSYHANLLKYATQFNDLEFVKRWPHSDLLIEDTSGRNMMYYGCKYDSIEILKWLVTPKSLNSPKSVNRTTIYKGRKITISKGSMTPESLKGAGYDANFQDGRRNTLLHYACQFNRISLVKWLLSLTEIQGGPVNLNIENDYKLTPLQYAVRFGHFEMVKFLLQFPSVSGKHSEIEKRYSSGQTLLHFAVKYSRLSIIQWLAASKSEDGGGADINAEDILERTPMHYAVIFGHYEIAEWLGNSRHRGGGGADVNAEDKYERTPLHYAVCLGHWSRDFKILKWLVINRKKGGGGADCYAEDKSGKTILHYLAELGEHELLIWLLEPRHRNGIGMDVMTEDNYGKTCVHYAIMFGNVDIVKYVFDQRSGLDVSIKDRIGNILLQYATENNQIYIANFIRSAMSK